MGSRSCQDLGGRSTQQKPLKLRDLVGASTGTRLLTESSLLKGPPNDAIVLSQSGITRTSGQCHLLISA
jgi:hypothetical protein